MRYSIHDRRHPTGNALTNTVLALVILTVVAGLVYGIFQWQHSQLVDLRQQIAQLSSQLHEPQQQNTKPDTGTDATTYTSTKGLKIKIYTPLRNAQVKSPVGIIGEVPGNWSFEASFPVAIKNASGDVIAHAPADVLGEWTTNELVPFAVKLTYTSPESGKGTIVLQKDNPSGLTTNDDSVTIPISF